VRRRYKDVEHFASLYLFYTTVVTAPQSFDYAAKGELGVAVDTSPSVDPPPYDDVVDYEATMRAIHARVCHPRRKNGQRQWVAWGIARVKMGMNHGCYAEAQRVHNRLALAGDLPGVYLLDASDRHIPGEQRSYTTVRNWVAEVDRIAEQVLSDRGMLQRNVPRLDQELRQTKEAS